LHLISVDRLFTGALKVINRTQYKAIRNFTKKPSILFNVKKTSTLSDARRKKDGETNLGEH
jgi:hypothetical protein